MILNVIIQITSIGQNAGPTFNLYSDADGYSNMFAAVSSSQLMAGFQVVAPANTTRIKIVSTGACGTVIYTDITGIPAPTPSITPSPTTTPIPTPSITPTPSSSDYPIFSPDLTPLPDPCERGSYHYVTCASKPYVPGRAYTCVTIYTTKKDCNCLGKYECLSVGSDTTDTTGVNG